MPNFSLHMNMESESAMDRRAEYNAPLTGFVSINTEVLSGTVIDWGAG